MAENTDTPPPHAEASPIEHVASNLDALAKRLESDTNAAIAAACEGQSWRRWEAIADHISGERLSGDWEWLSTTQLGAVPTIVLGRYLR